MVNAITKNAANQICPEVNMLKSFVQNYNIG